MTNLQISDDVLAAFLRGELNAAEAAAVEAWYDASAANRKLLGEVYYILYVNDRINDTAGIDVERSLRQFKRRMHAGRRISLRRIAVRAAAAAAVAVILLAGGVTTVSLSKRLAQPLTVITHLGERSQVVLPDGTKVWLNSASSVEYVAPFFSRERRVKMDGEAYFEVAKNPERPFIVDMGNASIRVLGTTFSVKADKGKDQITAVLLEAANRFESPTQQVLLAPDQQLTFIRSTNKIDIQSVNAKENLAWKDGLLKYKSIALCTLLNELEKRYEIPIHIENKRLLDPNVTVSGTFSEDQSLKEILQVISRSLPIKWSQRDGTYYIQ